LGQIKEDIDTRFFELNRRLDMLEKQIAYAVEPKGLFSSIIPRSLTSSSPPPVEEKPSPQPVEKKPISLPRPKGNLSSLPFEEAASKITK
jgi:hypothetical protein